VHMRRHWAGALIKASWEFAESRPRYVAAAVGRPVVRLNPTRWNADVMSMQRLNFPLRRPGALIITVLAATDVAYRLLLRESVRRALGMHQR